jgi:flagellar biosynthesis protein FlhG
MNSATNTKSSATIIPIAGGKGGVGKSLISANLALVLARLGYRTIAIDLDLGAANLHSYLGLLSTTKGVADFLRGGPKSLAECQTQTPYANLSLIAGDAGNPFMANITPAQQMRLMHEIRKLQADYILLDLGAGSSFLTLDFFRISPKGLLVTTPEYTAVTNMIAFLKNLAFRVMEHALPVNRELRKRLHELYITPVEISDYNVAGVQEFVNELDPQVAAKLRAVWRQFRPRLVFNVGMSPDDLEILTVLDRTLRFMLELEVDYIGFVPEDRAVVDAVRKKTALMKHNPKSYAAQDIIRLAKRIIKLWDQPIPDSARHLQQITRKLYQERQLPS